MFYVWKNTKFVEEVNGKAQDRKTKEFETIDGAEIQFHNYLATEMADANTKEITIMVIDDATNVHFRRHWVRSETVQSDFAKAQ